MLLKWTLFNLSKTSHIRIIEQFHNHRLFVTSSVVNGRKSRDPYDRRFGIRTSDAGPNKPGGSKELAEKLGRETHRGMPYPQGVYDIEGKFHPVKEMIPEFVVPDLKDFKLKPYVSYRCADVKQSEFTARDLFDAVIAKDIVEEYKEGKTDIKTIEKKIDALKTSPFKH